MNSKGRKGKTEGGERGKLKGEKVKKGRKKQTGMEAEN